MLLKARKLSVDSYRLASGHLLKSVESLKPIVTCYAPSHFNIIPGGLPAARKISVPVLGLVPENPLPIIWSEYRSVCSRLSHIDFGA